MIYGFPEIPILLSHWDADHYRVAKSLVAKKFLGTTYDYRNRGWIVPGNKYIRGPIAINLARKINDANNLFLWPSDTPVVETSNVQVLQRMKMSPGAPSSEKIDKNNNGALALVLGGTGGCTVYPGDANFECIPRVQGLNGRVKTIIATHHGSWRSLNPRGGKAIGSTIPRAASDGRVIFSYSAKNHFGYDATMTGSYYTAKGYKAVETTETLSGNGLDILEVLFKPTLRQSNKASARMALANNKVTI